MRWIARYREARDEKARRRRALADRCLEESLSAPSGYPIFLPKEVTLRDFAQAYERRCNRAYSRFLDRLYQEHLQASRTALKPEFLP